MNSNVMDEEQAVSYSPRFGLMVAIAAATIGLIYGYDSGSIGGALIFLKEDYNLSSLMVSIITTIVVVGSLIGAIFGPAITNGIGRQKTMVIVAIGFAVFAGLCAFPLGALYLTVVRFFLGVTIGLSTVAAPIFISELAPVKIRGALSISYQLSTSIGVFVSLFVDFLFSKSGAWEWMLGISAIPALLIVLILFRFPDTPRWYMMKGRRKDAVKVLKQLEPPEHYRSELAGIENDIVNNEKGLFREAFQKKYAKATLFVVVFGFIVQITGINTILYYSPTIFKSIGISDSNSILVSALVQIFSIIGIIVSLLTVDRWGRRPILLTGTVGMVIGDLIMVIVSFQGNHLSTAIGYLAFAGIALFNMTFYFSIGSLIWVYTGEIFPARLRSVGASLLLIADFIANIIATFGFPLVFDSFGGQVAFGAFMVLAILAWFFLFWLAPETRGRSLEDIRKYWENGGKWTT